MAASGHRPPPTAARVIMVHVDELPLLERVVAHAAGVLLGLQQAVELLLSQPVLEIRYFRLDFLRDSGDSRCGWSRLYSLLRSMVSAVLQRPPCPRVCAHAVFFRGIHCRTALAPFRQGISPTPRICTATRRIKYSKNVGATGFEPVTPRL